MHHSFLYRIAKHTMPLRRRKTRKNTRVSTVTRSVAIPPRNFIHDHVAGAPQTIRRTLAWAYFTTFDTTHNTYQEPTVVTLNNPYDPDAALGGLSASGFAKYMAFYTKCFCIAARIKVKYATNAATGVGETNFPMAVGVVVTTNSTALGGVVNAVQNGLCDYRVHNESPDSGVLDMSIDVARYLNKPKVLDDPQLFCTSTAGPSQVICAHLFTDSVVSSAITTGITYFLEVEMDCVFTDPLPFT